MTGKRPKAPKLRNPIASVLAHGSAKQKVIPSGKNYSRKPKHPKTHSDQVD